MKYQSRQKALAELEGVRKKFQAQISEFERRAADCALCTTPGACCLDAHFVNVRVSHLEADAITDSISNLPEKIKRRVLNRAKDAAERYTLSAANEPDEMTYACPLFEPGIGCLVHNKAKPLPCIAHACYSSAEDLPPDELLETAEQKVVQLNESVYGRTWLPEPIPIAILARTPQPASENDSGQQQQNEADVIPNRSVRP